MTEVPNQPVAAAVIVHNGRVLLVQRHVAEGSLSWQFPAGKVEPGEAPITTATREAFEETGVRVHALRFIGDRLHPETGRHIYYIGCDLLDGQATVAAEREVSAVAWCTAAELAERIPSGIYRPVQRYLSTVLLP